MAVITNLSLERVTLPLKCSLWLSGLHWCACYLFH